MLVEAVNRQFRVNWDVIRWRWCKKKSQKRLVSSQECGSDYELGNCHTELG